MIKKSGTDLVISFLLFFGVILICPVSAENSVKLSQESNFSENSEVSNVHYSYYTYFFGLNSYGNTIITRYGKLPVLETEEQRESWNSTLEELSNEMKDTIASKYMYPHGQIVTCGINAKGYFIILFKYGNVDEPLMNEIYGLIDNSAREIGIQDIPVKFGYGIYKEQIELGQEGRYQNFGESTENLSESDIHVIEEYMKKKPATPVHKTVAAYGKIPLLKDQKEIYAWGDKLFSIHSSSDKKILPYGERGQVITYGVELTRLALGIHENVSSKEKITIVKEIYGIIDEEARKQNVTDVPVVFYQGVFINETATEDAGAVNETANLSTSKEKNADKRNNGSSFNINNSSGNESSKKSFAPGFEFLGSLICLYGGWKLRKK